MTCHPTSPTDTTPFIAARHRRPGLNSRRLLPALALLFLLAAPLLLNPAPAAAKVNVPSEEAAIVLAVFGTSFPEALPGILTIYDEVQAAYPETTVRLAFTSNIIRRIWHSRRDDAAYRAAHPEIPAEIFTVKAPLATIADLVDEDYGHIIVQPTHIAAGEEFSDLADLVHALNTVTTVKKRNRPFQQIILGRPALGQPGIKHPYRQDLERVAALMAVDVEQARQNGSALVYMAHGNRTFSTGVFFELEHLMRRHYPEVDTYFTMATGFPEMEYTVQRLLDDGATSALLVPFMTVAGDHTHNDMAGDDDDSLRSLLQAKGIDSTAKLEGLGERQDFARIYVENIRDAATAAGLKLK
ncbi:sirohydrochlorin cobaltochelatase [Desulfurivibrio alkaliphilus]|uniref:Anaerobic cobalt chelatase n=1 Tax=Desulfurivibrio alkaliphilus (strain DSM 19089 / UNIQEM U267 / AHT2) TaxID=589865 RepID=D6Z3Z7_DESAT|nr:sirohydrochlorin cobaltochelatase [Desulfurivibrio alkaliphilus]ADH86272.1 anaerobic cobalt chelatase [Desulfurivibrio alkaliphilus AHT 2]